MSQVHLTEHDAAEVEAIVDRLGDVFLRIEMLLPPPVGRPREWTVRGCFAGLLLLARHEPAFFIERIAPLVATLPLTWRQRLDLIGADGEPLTTRQWSYAWNLIGRALDPARAGLSAEQRNLCLELLERTVNDMLWATVPRRIRRAWGGDVAVDATLMWAFGRPPGSGSDKQRATGRDGDGLPTFLSKVDPMAFDGPPVDSNHPYLDMLVPTPPPAVAVHANGRRRRCDRGRRSVGATWIGHKRIDKVVFGFAHHAAVMVNPGGRGDDVPALMVGAATTPATANPAATAMSTLRDLHRRFSSDPDRPGQPLGDVLADGGYSGARAEHWQIPLRAMGAEPIFRLHPQNQEGHRGAIRDGQLLKIDGRFYCSCLPLELRDLTYPNRPTADAALNTRRKGEYRQKLVERAAFELRPAGKYRDIGLRFTSPHTDDCPVCGPGHPDCCASKSWSLTWAELGHYQRDRFGSPEWEASYDRRNRIEGWFGILKNESVANYVRGTARFFDYGKVCLAFAFKAMATNLHLLALWHARRTGNGPTGGPTRSRRGRPRTNATLDEIAADPDKARPRAPKRRRPRAKAPPRKRGTHVFETLGDPT